MNAIEQVGFSDRLFLEFVERANRESSFPGGAAMRAARHLNELFISCVDGLCLVVSRVGSSDEDQVYNVMPNESFAFRKSCQVVVDGKPSNLQRFLNSQYGATGISCKVMDIEYHSEVWDYEADLDSQRSPRRELRLGALSKLRQSAEDRPKSRLKLFIFVTNDEGKDLRIEIYFEEHPHNIQERDLETFCVKVHRFLSEESTELTVPPWRWPEQDRDDPLEYSETHFDEPKILYPYVERATSETIALVESAVFGRSDSSSMAAYIAPTQNQARILSEFIFVVNTARQAFATGGRVIPNNVGYLLTHSQIAAIRHYHDMHPDDSVVKDLADHFNLKTADAWIDCLQKQIYVTVNEAGFPVRPFYGISSYVFETQHPEYLEDVAGDVRLDPRVQYPEVVRKVEDIFIHGKCLFMIPIFLEGRVAACLWMNSNRPLRPDMRLRLISAVRKYEHRVSEAIRLQWKVLKEYGERSERDWVIALENLAVHPLKRLQKRLRNNTAVKDEEMREIDYVSEVIHAIGRKGAPVERVHYESLHRLVGLALLELNCKDHATIENQVDKEIKIRTNRPLFSEVLRTVLDNSLQEVIGTTGAKIRITVNKPDLGKVLLYLWDSGKPFPSNILSDFSSPIERSTHEGDGRGLYLAHLIMKRLLGNINLGDDRKTICITLPYKS